MTRPLEYYLSLEYSMEVTREEGLFVAIHSELPGCVAQGDTAAEAIANLDDAREAWMGVRFEDGLCIAEPLPASPP